MPELALVDGSEPPESDVILIRLELMGIRDCELRFVVVVGEGDGDGCSTAGERMVMDFPTELARGAIAKEPVPKSLLDLRCIPGGRAGTGLSKSMPSREGVTPMYHAVGDEGETFIIM